MLSWRYVIISCWFFDLGSSPQKVFILSCFLWDWKWSTYYTCRVEQRPVDHSSFKWQPVDQYWEESLERSGEAAADKADLSRLSSIGRKALKGLPYLQQLRLHNNQLIHVRNVGYLSFQLMLCGSNGVPALFYFFI